MSRLKRIWPAMLFALAAWLMPAKGYCVVDDPYAYKSLVGRITFEFQRNNSSQNDAAETESSTFLQRYSLDARGFLLNRRLIIYDAGWLYQTSDYSSDTTELESKSTNLYLRTTLLPLSSIPLTLYGSRQSNEVSTIGDPDVRKIYGLEWYMRFRTLPQTYLKAEREQLDANDGSTTITDKYRVELEKEIGPTHNVLSYDYVTSNAGGPESTQYIVNVMNSTRISRSTHFSLGASRSVSEPAGEPDTTLHGLSLSLRSTPSKDFYQSHSYNFYSRETDGENQQGTSYNGRMTYDMTRRLYSALSLNVNNTKNETGTSSSENNSLSTSANVRYKITDALNLMESVTYSKTDTNSTDPTANVADRERLRALTTLNYAKRLSWATLSTGGGLGYSSEKSQTESGEGLDQTFNVGLSNIDLNKYFLAATSYNYANTTTLSGDNIDSTTQGYSLSLYNKIWRQYAQATATYSLSSHKSHTMLFEETKEKARLDAESVYFKDTKLKAFVEYQRSFQEITGDAEAFAKGGSASHERDFYKGLLKLSASYSTTDSTFEGGSESISLTMYTLHYSRRLLRNLDWQALLQRSVQETKSSSRTVNRIRNAITYPFRSWEISAYHEYTTTDEQNRERTDSTIFVRATRVFMRFW